MAKGSFVIKDSGQRESFTSGMVRDTAGDKTNVALVFDGPMLWRWAYHLTLGAVKYAKRNWMKASGEAELERFRESAVRHFAQWYRGDDDEDHAAAVLFNINGAEYVRDKLLLASVGSENAHSAGPQPPASQRSTELPDPYPSPLETLQELPDVAKRLLAPDLCQADPSSERRRPGPDDEGQMAPSVDRPQPKSPSGHTGEQRQPEPEHPGWLARPVALAEST